MARGRTTAPRLDGLFPWKQIGGISDRKTSGNQRVALQGMYVFAGLDGLRTESREEVVVSLMPSMASDATDDVQIACRADN